MMGDESVERGIRRFDRKEILGRLRSVELGSLTRYEYELVAQVEQLTKDLEDEQVAYDLAQKDALAQRYRAKQAEQRIAELETLLGEARPFLSGQRLGIQGAAYSLSERIRAALTGSRG